MISLFDYLLGDLVCSKKQTIVHSVQQETVIQNKRLLC